MSNDDKTIPMCVSVSERDYKMLRILSLNKNVTISGLIKLWIDDESKKYFESTNNDEVVK